MPYYSLPLWNPVLSKVFLSMPWRHNGGAEVQLHSFLTLATLPAGKNSHTLWIKDWVVPQPVWTFQRREKPRVSTGLQNLCLAAYSTVSIAHSFTQWTQTCNEHTCMYSVLYIACCNANSPRWYMELFSIESVCLADCISNCLYLQLTPVLSNIISQLSFHSHIRKGKKELPNR